MHHGTLRCWRRRTPVTVMNVRGVLRGSTRQESYQIWIAGIACAIENKEKLDHIHGLHVYVDTSIHSVSFSFDFGELTLQSTGRSNKLPVTVTPYKSQGKKEKKQQDNFLARVILLPLALFFCFFSQGTPSLVFPFPPTVRAAPALNWVSSDVPASSSSSAPGPKF